MIIELYITKSEHNRLYKDLRNMMSLEGKLRDSSSIIAPSFTLQAEPIITQYNYCWIEYFQRWYFIKDIVSFRNNVWQIDCKVDVLVTYRDDILKSTALLNSAAGVTSHSSIYAKDMNPYINSNKYISSVKSSTEIIKFPNTLLEQGEWILVTAGGL